MSMIKNIVRKIPGVRRPWRIYYMHKLRRLNTEAVFTEIFRKNRWGDTESVSGPGSSISQTRQLVRELPKLFKDLKVLTVLDIPCGDLNWMRKIDLTKINYIGADIIKEIILQNMEKYGGKNIYFYHLNLIKDDLPKVDLVICRDCLVHFSFNDIFLALKNICHSKSKYLLTTTFTARDNDHDILTGKWRVLNLTKPPFNLPEPVKLVNEGCFEKNGLYADKSLGLWKIEDIANIINRGYNLYHL